MFLYHLVTLQSSFFSLVGNFSFIRSSTEHATSSVSRQGLTVYSSLPAITVPMADT